MTTLEDVLKRTHVNQVNVSPLWPGYSGNTTNQIHGEDVPVTTIQLHYELDGRRQTGIVPPRAPTDQIISDSPSFGEELQTGTQEQKSVSVKGSPSSSLPNLPRIDVSFLENALRPRVVRRHRKNRPLKLAETLQVPNPDPTYKGNDPKLKMKTFVPLIRLPPATLETYREKSLQINQRNASHGKMMGLMRRTILGDCGRGRPRKYPVSLTGSRRGGVFAGGCNGHAVKSKHSTQTPETNRRKPLKTRRMSKYVPVLLKPIVPGYIATAPHEEKSVLTSKSPDASTPSSSSIALSPINNSMHVIMDSSVSSTTIANHNVSPLTWSNEPHAVYQPLLVPVYMPQLSNLQGYEVVNLMSPSPLLPDPTSDKNIIWTTTVPAKDSLDYEQDQTNQNSYESLETELETPLCAQDDWIKDFVSSEVTEEMLTNVTKADFLPDISDLTRTFIDDDVQIISVSPPSRSVAAAASASEVRLSSPTFPRPSTPSNEGDPYENDILLIHAEPDPLPLPP